MAERRANHHPIVAALLVVVLGVSLVTLWQMHGVRSLIRDEWQDLIRATMQSITSTWLSGGVTHAVTTPQDPGETVEAWIARHAEAVAAAQAVWPVDPK